MYSTGTFFMTFMTFSSWAEGISSIFDKNQNGKRYPFFTYRISTNSFHGIFFFLDLKIVENSNSCHKFQYFHLINWIFAVENIEGKKQFKGGNYLRKYIMIKSFFFAIWIGQAMRTLELVQPFFTSFEFWGFLGFTLSYLVSWKGL